MASAGLAGEPLLQRLVKPLDLSAGLRVVGPGVTQRNAERGGLAFQGDPAVAAVGAGEHGTVVGEQPLRAAVAGDGRVQVGDDVAGFEHGAGGAADQQPGMVVFDVEDLDLAAVRQ